VVYTGRFRVTRQFLASRGESDTTCKQKEATMNRNTRNLLAHPFMVWTDLAWKIGEMSMASAQVIAHRTARISASGPIPSARDRNEFTRMGQEKLDAAGESVRAMLAHLTKANLALGARMFAQIMATTTAFTSLSASRSPTQFITRQAKLAKSMARSGMTASEISGSAARMAKRGLKPIHARATANARRLAKR
jgi:hypothetical protein